MHDLNCRREPSKIIEILCHNLSVDFTEQRSRLFKEFHTLKLETCNNVREYGIKLESIFKELRSLGAEISPEQLKFQLFHGLPGVYGPIVAVLMESTRSAVLAEAQQIVQPTYFPSTAAYIPIVAFILSFPKMTSWIKGIATGNGRVRCEKAGQATLHVRRGISVQDITLKHVLYVPTLGRNLLSINRLVTAVGGTYVYKDSDSEVIDASGASVLCGKRTAHCSLHTVVLGSPATDLLRAAYPADAAVTNRLALWHRRLGHLNDVFSVCRG
jgi:hypothetical protein